MKKQFLLLVLLVISGLTTAYAQPNCTQGPLAPAAGSPYTYTVTVNDPPFLSSAGQYTWYVTTNVDLLNATGVVPNNGGEIVATGTYNAPAAGQNSISITWTAQAIVNGMTNPYYLVIKFAGSNAGVCNAMNMKVWEVKPINKFLLAVNVYNGTDKYCAADVSSATVTPGTNPTVNYQYGVNTIYARVTPKNYTGDWVPSFKIGGLDAIQTLASVTWSADSAFATTHTTTIAGNIATSTDAHTSAFTGSSKLYVKINIDNHHFENLADLSITISVDGVIHVGAATLNDVISETDCNDELAFGKTLPITLKARPIITPDPAVGPFITKNP
ncbi:MAG: hypothetical protein ACOYM0_03765 [Bacteroidales bacterium]